MYKEAIRPAWAEINLTNLDYNIKRIKEKVKEQEIIGVIKADAYGHGAEKCAQVLQANGVKTFAVATLHEGIALRQAGFKEDIIILGLTPSLYADVLVKFNLTPVVCSYENAQAISAAAEAAGKVVDGFVAVDTGMGRIGYLYTEIVKAASELKLMEVLPNFNVRGVFSHMATADAFDKTFAKEQEENFNKFCQAIAAEGIDISEKTLANSASIMELPSIYFDDVRPGIVLYGCYPSDEVNKENLSLKPVMSIKANIVHLKDVPEGFSVGYGRKFVAERPSKIATIALGYADGYPRPYSPHAQVIVGGKKCKVAGNICMDQCMIDVTDVEDVKVGDLVIVMGSDGPLSVTADDIAKATGTINYEICCAFGQRLPKVYVK